MNMTPTPSILLPLPIELPDELFEEVDCTENMTRYAAFHYDHRTNRVLRENGISIKPCPDEWLLAALYLDPEIAKWCDKNDVQLSTGVHWLIHDYRHRRSFIVDPDTAMKFIEEQALPYAAADKIPQVPTVPNRGA